MKTNRHYLILIFLALVLSSCHEEHVNISSEDDITFRDVPIDQYNSVEIGNGFNAFITFSEEEESIQVEGNTNLQHLIIAEISNNKLTVKLKNNVNINGNPTLNVYIHAKSIQNFNATANSNMTLENVLIADNAYISISANSSFSGELDVEYLDLEASANVTADLYGHVGSLNADLSALVRLSDYDLVVDHVKLNMAADCAANLTVNNTIAIDAKAACVLNYKGNASIVHQHLESNSRIRKMD